MRNIFDFEPAKAPVHIPISLIDDFGEVDELVKSFAPTQKLHTKLRDEIKALIENAGGAETFAESGERFTLDISACKMERKVDAKAARRKVGFVVFMKICSVTMKSLEPFLIKPEIDALAVSSQTGARSFTTTALNDDSLQG